MLIFAEIIYSFFIIYFIIFILAETKNWDA